jgi:hypothetical protein
MSAVFKCDLCKQVDDLRSIKLKHCNSCESILAGITAESYNAVEKIMEEKFNTIIRNQSKVVDLLNWLYEHKTTEFTQHYGTQGLDLLRKSLAE